MSFFFFQAEDGIRDLYVTGVQTCALPISFKKRVLIVEDDPEIRNSFSLIVNSSPKFFVVNTYGSCEEAIKHLNADKPDIVLRSEERRVGKECRYRLWLLH